MRCVEMQQWTSLVLQLTTTLHCPMVRKHNSPSMTSYRLISYVTHHIISSIHQLTITSHRTPTHRDNSLSMTTYGLESDVRKCGGSRLYLAVERIELNIDHMQFIFHVYLSQNFRYLIILGVCPLNVILGTYSGRQKVSKVTGSRTTPIVGGQNCVVIMAAAHAGSRMLCDLLSCK